VTVAPVANAKDVPTVSVPPKVVAPLTPSASLILIIVESSELIDVPLNFTAPISMFPVPFGVTVMMIQQ
jgi:hypothetical protein